MANPKYFLVKRISDGSEFLVCAPRANLAKITVVGGKVQAKVATEEQIILHFQAGHALHDKSRPEGEGKMFLVSSTPPVLVRAKNAGDAISLADDSTDYEISTASPEIIVRLMTANATVMTYSEHPKTTSGTVVGDTEDNNGGPAATAVEGLAPAGETTIATDAGVAASAELSDAEGHEGGATPTATDAAAAA